MVPRFLAGMLTPGRNLLSWFAPSSRMQRRSIFLCLNYLPTSVCTLRPSPWYSIGREQHGGALNLDDREFASQACPAHPNPHAGSHLPALSISLRLREFYVTVAISQPHGHEFAFCVTRIRSVTVTPIEPATCRNLQIHSAS